MQVTFGNLRSPTGPAVVFDDSFPKGWPVAFDNVGGQHTIRLSVDYYPAYASLGGFSREFDGNPYSQPYCVAAGTCFRASGAEAGALSLLGVVAAG